MDSDGERSALVCRQRVVEGCAAVYRCGRAEGVEGRMQIAEVRQKARVLNSHARFLRGSTPTTWQACGKAGGGAVHVRCAAGGEGGATMGDAGRP